MLSKYYDLIKNNEQREDMESMSSLRLKLSEHLGAEIKPLSPGGTLGIFFECDIFGKRKFIKTHGTCDESRENLIKEIEILSKIYGNTINVESFCLDIDNSKKYILIMDYLNITHQEYTLNDVKELILQYKYNLINVDSNLVNYNQNNLIEAAVVSNDELYKRNFIEKEIYEFCVNAIKRFENYYKDELCICHGDLSNVNIVKLKNDLVALDWEDAFICVEQYDILYWLTFFSQRKYYNSLLFCDVGINEAYAKDIMVMILTVKSYMSYMNASYIGNSISINDRIREIIKI